MDENIQQTLLYQNHSWMKTGEWMRYESSWEIKFRQNAKYLIREECKAQSIQIDRLKSDKNKEIVMWERQTYENS